MIANLLVVCAALAVVAAIFALWQSLRAAFGAVDSHAFASAAGSVERQALEDRKASLLRGLKDLKFEYQIGKLSDGDYRQLDGELRALARKVLRLLDEDIKGHHEQAREDLEAYLREHVGGDPYREAPAKVEDDDAIEELLCQKCATLNDPDATFCKKCGEKVLAESESESDAETESESESESGSEAESESETGSEDEAGLDSEKEEA